MLAGAAAALGTVIVCAGVAADFHRFRAHVDAIRTIGAQPFRMFPSNPAGEWALTGAASALARISLGWPAFLAGVLGFGCALWPGTPAAKRLWWAALPAISYALTFLAVIGYVYDRFLLPEFIVLALGAGFLIARLERSRLRAAAPVVAAGVIGYSLAYASAVDLSMVNDSRYAVEAWLAGRAEPGATIGVVASLEHAPRLDRFFTRFVDPTDEAIRAAPYDYLVVNGDWVERFGPERLQYAGYHDLIQGRLPYREVFDVDRPVTFLGTPFASRFSELGRAGLTTLTKVNPPMRVFRRVPPDGGLRAAAAPGTQ